jgi:hypothetical protein
MIANKAGILQDGVERRGPRQRRAAECGVKAFEWYERAAKRWAMDWRSLRWGVATSRALVSQTVEKNEANAVKGVELSRLGAALALRRT